MRHHRRQHHGSKSTRAILQMSEMAWHSNELVMGQCDDVSPAHDERLNYVASLLAASGAKSVVDLGCGSGALLQRLLGLGVFDRVVGVDPSISALAIARSVVVAEQCEFLHGSFLSSALDLRGFDAAAMVETIEHVDLGLLSQAEHTVFSVWQPKLVVMTTPNKEYNPILGLGSDEFRHADHKFEWDRRKFFSWASGVAERNGYGVRFEYIGPSDHHFGSSTQMAVFTLSNKKLTASCS